jgi:hypothetical protein
LEERQDRQMENLSRKPLQGVSNIVKFNWHFYVLAFAAILVLVLANQFVSPDIALLNLLIWLAIGFILASTFVSLLVSFYVYDCSNLYKLDWLDLLEVLPTKTAQNVASKTANLVNINAGFDETSALLAHKYKAINLQVFDFYNPQTHTEISIERARKAYPPYPNTQLISTTALPLQNNTVDLICNILAAHEIRNTAERIAFFEQLKQKINTEGKIIVVEHLRDLPNFLAYQIGFLHFYSQKSWLHTFEAAGLEVCKEMKLTPFLCVFVLGKKPQKTG